ncbi:MAG: ABC transporter permease [Candidatus Aminicenantes bacterium]|nr:ABC transporter permease [Candidatus Aminicenantes bacterium]
MTIPKLAVRNLLGGGTKFWLNAVVLSLSFVAIIWAQGLMEGLDEEASLATIDDEAGGGHYRVESYDPLDPFTYQDAHGPVPAPLQARIDEGKAAAILLVPATIYPQGRVQSAVLKGIEPGQKILSLPTSRLTAASDEIPALIGARMAESVGLKEGDILTVRWRDAKGAFDALEAVIAGIFETKVATVDAGQIWVPLARLRDMAAMPGEATIVVLEQGAAAAESFSGWAFRDQADLLADIRAFVRMKTIGSSIFYVLLLSLAALAIFNTQILSIWRRRKEIGTLMAMGMTRGRVIGLFTLEGSLLAFLAALVGAVYGIPLLAYFAVKGFAMPGGQGDSFGLAVGQSLYPVYSLGLVAATAVLVFATTAVVSYLPARKIAKLKPTDALKGKRT